MSKTELCTQKSLCILLTWYGRWPFWIDFFLESCHWNPTVNWIIVTDCEIPDDVPDNVKIIKHSLESFSQQVSETLQIRFTPASAYKLCDIKPMLGLILEDEIRDYDYFAFGDLDVIYGDLRQYYTHDLLLAYNCISNHVTRASGHLCLLKNTRQMRNVFREARDWKDCLEKPEHTAFDESQFSKVFVKNKNLPAGFRSILKRFHYYSRTSWFREAYSTPEKRIPWTDGTRNFPKKWYWKEGRLTTDRDGSREFPYLHFMHWKGDVWPKVDDKSALINGNAAGSHEWIISNDGFTVIR